MDERTAYVIEKEITDRNDAAIACAAVLEVLRPVLRVALVDAYSDYESQMPPDVAEAQRWLRQQGWNQHRGDAGMNVEVGVVDAHHWATLCRYAPWSIHVELYGDGHAPLATLHDCGCSVTAHLTPAEATDLGGRLTAMSAVTPCTRCVIEGGRRAGSAGGDDQPPGRRPPIPIGMCRSGHGTA